MSLAARIARSLESGRGGLASSAASRAWGALASRALSRPLTFRAGARVVAVGGSTLGGSGKTPLAIACAKTLAEQGHRVAFVGHAYRAHPGRARVVAHADAVSLVGDEALVACHALSALRVPVIVAPSRQAALDHALSLADVAVVDGALQLHPARAHLSLLALDAREPWGAGACPPSGDLRAPPRSLVSACDRVVVLGPVPEGLASLSCPVDEARVASRGAFREGTLLSWDELRARRVGLWTSVARPRRVEEQLRSHGVKPRLVLSQGDHDAVEPAVWARAAREGRDERVDLWLCTAKCAEHLRPYSEVTPLATLEHALILPRSLSGALGALHTPDYPTEDRGLAAW